MAADFDKPTVDDEYVNIFPDVRANQEALAKMFSDGSEANIPTGSVRFLNNQFYTWNGSSWIAAPISLSGGGTGSSDAATARTALGANNAANLDAGTMSADRVPVLAVDTKTSGDLPLTRTSGTLTGTKVDQSSTTVRGTVQLNNTLTSVSTTEGLTAAQGKALKDTADTLATAASVTSLSNSIAADFAARHFSKIDWDGTTNSTAYTAIRSTSGMTVTRVSTGRVDLGHPVVIGAINAIITGNALDAGVVISFNNLSDVTGVEVHIQNLAGTYVDSDFMIAWHGES